MAENNNLEVLYENKDIVAVYKPHGLSVHNQEETQNANSILRKQLKLTKVYPVHRLDKESSGVQIFALSQTSAAMFADEFHKKNVKKQYIGILRGQYKESEFIWKDKLSDKACGRKNPAGITSSRLECETRGRVVVSSKYFTQCEFDLITGRQHQIRKHCAVNKHQLVGDSRYGEPNYNKKISNLYSTSRMFLHCSSMVIMGIEIKAQLPEDFDKLFP